MPLRPLCASCTQIDSHQQQSLAVGPLFEEVGQQHRGIVVPTCRAQQGGAGTHQLIVWRLSGQHGQGLFGALQCKQRFGFAAKGQRMIWP
jgi:hypothetical protein